MHIVLVDITKNILIYPMVSESKMQYKQMVLLRAEEILLH